jgi:predicted metal-dependent hydrolase
MLYLKRGSTVINYTIRKSFRAKYLRVDFHEHGIQVVAPVGMNDQHIKLFIENKKDLIFKKFEKHMLYLARSKGKLKFGNGDMLYYLGKEFPLKVNENEKSLVGVRFTEDCIQVNIDKNIPPEKRREEIYNQLEKWYITKAKQQIYERLEFYSDIMGVEFNKVRVKNQKTRWGSCSQKRNLNFNWKLVMAPIEIIDYVIVHELSHLRHMNHSKDFWEVVGGYIPDYLIKRKWLRDNGLLLDF